MGNRSGRRPAEDAPGKPCKLCRDGKSYVDYKDTALLRKYISDRGKIRSHRITGACPQHQRRMATAIKNAREMALLPYATLVAPEMRKNRRA